MSDIGMPASNHKSEAVAAKPRWQLMNVVVANVEGVCAGVYLSNLPLGEVGEGCPVVHLRAI